MAHPRAVWLLWQISHQDSQPSELGDVEILTVGMEDVELAFGRAMVKLFVALHRRHSFREGIHHGQIV